MFSKKKSKIWTFVGIIIFIFVIYFLSKHTRSIESILIKSGPLAPIIAIILYPLLAPTPITTDPITVIVSVIYGPFVGFLIAWIGNTLAALVEYFLGTRIGGATNFKDSKDKLPFGLGKLPMNSIGVLILGRMIPGYGGKIISILAGIYKVPIRRFLWTTAVTNLLGSSLLAFGGSGLVHLIKISKILKHITI
jgi:uncharacterized membrane protein YdjX (TVP38/TMEM64 family)